MPKHKGLTPNQRIFCDEYLTDRNGTRAYMVAYRGVKKESTAGVNANRLLKNAKIRAYVDAQLEKISKKALITPTRLKQEEARLAYSNVSQLFDGECTIAPGELPEDVARAVSGIEIKTVEVLGVKTTTYKYKFWDKGQALKRLEQMEGMFAEDNKQRTDIVYLAPEAIVKPKDFGT